MYKYILFDLDGTVIDSKPGVTESVKYSLEPFGIHAENDELVCFIGPPLRDSYMRFFGFDEEQTEAAVKKYRQRYSTIGLFENYLYPGMTDLLPRLCEAGLRCVVASSKPENFVRQILERHGIHKHFTEIVGGLLDGSREAKPDIIREVFRRLNISNDGLSDCVMVGDRKFDLLGAQECGIDFIGAGYGYAPAGELEELGAKFIARDVPELEKILFDKR